MSALKLEREGIIDKYVVLLVEMKDLCFVIYRVPD
jgi:hypothetical protein